MSWSWRGVKAALPEVRSSKSLRISCRSWLCALMLDASAPSVTGCPVKDTNSSLNSPIISAILPGAQVSLIELMSIPKNTEVFGSTARTTYSLCSGLP